VSRVTTFRVPSDDANRLDSADADDRMPTHGRRASQGSSRRVVPRELTAPANGNDVRGAWSPAGTPAVLPPHVERGPSYPVPEPSTEPSPAQSAEDAGHARAPRERAVHATDAANGRQSSGNGAQSRTYRGRPAADPRPRGRDRTADRSDVGHDAHRQSLGPTVSDADTGRVRGRGRAVPERGAKRGAQRVAKRGAQPQRKPKPVAHPVAARGDHPRDRRRPATTAPARSDERANVSPAADPGADAKAQRLS
jgi:hypothetical protein